MIDTVQIVLGMAIGGIIGYILQHVRPALKDIRDNHNAIFRLQRRLNLNGLKDLED